MKDNIVNTLLSTQSLDVHSKYKMVYTIVVHLYANNSVEDIEKLRTKLIEASQMYSKDKETLSWFVMQDHQDPRAFSIVERYEQESVRTRIFSHSNGGHAMC